MIAMAPCIAAALPGCARPQGELFPAMQPSRVWPAPPETPRIQLLGVIRSSHDLRAPQSAAEALGAALRGPRPPVTFVGPHSVAVRGDLLAVADSAGASVHILSLTDREHILVTGFGNDRLAVPVGAAWAEDELLVSDAGLGEILRIDPHGQLVGRFGKPDLGRPVGIAYAAQRNQVFVADGDAHQVKVFARSGELLHVIGQRGSGPGEFNYPSHLCVFHDRLLVADSGNFRVQVLSLDGSFIHSIGTQGNAAGDLALPKGVAADRDGHIYVIDARFENLQIFDDRGSLLLAIGEEGPGLGEFSLPAGIAIDELDRIWIADAGNRRLQVFQYLRDAS